MVVIPCQDIDRLAYFHIIQFPLFRFRLQQSEEEESSQWFLVAPLLIYYPQISKICVTQIRSRTNELGSDSSLFASFNIM